MYYRLFSSSSSSFSASDESEPPGSENKIVKKLAAAELVLNEAIHRTLPSVPYDGKVMILLKQMIKFNADAASTELEFPHTLSSTERARVHDFANCMGLRSEATYDPQKGTFVKIFKNPTEPKPLSLSPTPQVTAKLDEKLEAIPSLVLNEKKASAEAFKAVVDEKKTPATPVSSPVETVPSTAAADAADEKEISSATTGLEEKKDTGKSHRHRHRVWKPVGKDGSVSISPRVPEVDTRGWDRRRKELYEQIKAFVNDGMKKELVIKDVDSSDRRAIHDIAEHFYYLQHSSLGTGRVKQMVLRKLDAKEYNKKKRTSEAFQKALKGYLDTVKSPAPPPSPLPVSAPSFSKSITSLSTIGSADLSAKADCFRYVDWNIEWMDHWFESDLKIHATFDGLARRVAAMIKEINPDVLAVQEGPSTKVKMELFVSTYLEGGYVVIGGFEDSSSQSSMQQLFFLVRKTGKLKNARLFTEVDNRLKEKWAFDVTGEFQIEDYSFTRRPVVIRGEVDIDGKEFPVAFCNMHAKSKYINRGEKLWESKNDEERMKFIKQSVKNRRRIAGECLHLRRILDELIFNSAEFAMDPLLIVSGDFNDGPGMDFFEENYLLGDCVYALLGSTFNRTKLLYSILDRDKFVPREEQWSVSFDDYVDGQDDKLALLDNLFISDAVLDRVERAMICHVLFNKYVTSANKDDRHARPSDHRPVLVDFRLH
eukprot:TRINITY_DN8209_c0_g1_i1.p1 TRINITY_DN8209_c0_g1~~TRINITY_DN8209_c0_g1_i1.p1  ORF type:complete len:751 (-),score=205.03 TRINITY_DN8209_c0_g1_i1:277-2406(-)